MTVVVLEVIMIFMQQKILQTWQFTCFCTSTIVCCILLRGLHYYAWKRCVGSPTGPQKATCYFNSFTKRYSTQFYQEAHKLQATPRQFFIYFSVLNHSFPLHLHSSIIITTGQSTQYPKDACHQSHCDQRQCQKIQIISDSCHQQSKKFYAQIFSNNILSRAS